MCVFCGVMNDWDCVFFRSYFELIIVWIYECFECDIVCYVYVVDVDVDIGSVLCEVDEFDVCVGVIINIGCVVYLLVLECGVILRYIVRWVNVKVVWVMRVVFVIVGVRFVYEVVVSCGDKRNVLVLYCLSDG